MNKTKAKLSVLHERKLILPAVVVVAIVTQVPFILTIVLSLFKWMVLRPDLGTKFVFFRNFIRIFSDSNFYTVLLNTFILTIASLTLCMIIGMMFAILLDRNFPGVNIVRTLIIAPFFVMDTAIAVIWKNMILEPTVGFVGYFALWTHTKPIHFLGNYPLLTIIILVVWQWTPFFFLVLLAGLQGISKDFIDVAEVDGANWFQTFIYIKIPLIISHVEVAIMLGLIFILKVFGLIFATTSGGPGHASTNLPFFVYRTAFWAWDVGEAAALAIITIVFVLLVVMMLFKFLKRRFVEVEL